MFLYISVGSTDNAHNLNYSQTAPHAPATPAVWYADRFNDSIAPRTPNYNVQSPDKVDWIGTNPVLYGDAVDNIDQQWRDRLRSLLSVDDMIQSIFDTLKKYNAIDNTYVLFSSDHGFHLGLPCLYILQSWR